MDTQTENRQQTVVNNQGVDMVKIPLVLVNKMKECISNAEQWYQWLIQEIPTKYYNPILLNKHLEDIWNIQALLEYHLR